MKKGIVPGLLILLLSWLHYSNNGKMPMKLSAIVYGVLFEEGTTGVPSSLLDY